MVKFCLLGKQIFFAGWIPPLCQGAREHLAILLSWLPEVNYLLGEYKKRLSKMLLIKLCDRIYFSEFKVSLWYWGCQGRWYMVRSSQSEKECNKQSFSLMCLICGMTTYFIIHRHSPHGLEIPWGQDKSGECLLKCQLWAHSQNEATGNFWDT